MEICPNCCNNLIERKYKKGFWSSKRLKCTECGYETSEWEQQKQTDEFLERIKENRINKHFIQDENYEWHSNDTID